jgi:murein L,D-transpeptidase YafK
MLLAGSLALGLPMANATRAQNAAERVLPQLLIDTGALKLRVGAPVFIRIFKERAALEVWLKGEQRYQLFRSYPICAYSGELGPKLREGDGQAPEGIYLVRAHQMNPASQFHLSFNLGYPNEFDRAHARTGSALMVHGNCVSIGCYAMTDPKIEEIYTLMSAAFAAGQTAVPVHAYPFRFSTERLLQAAHEPHYAFWQDLARIDQRFEQTGLPPSVQVRKKRYVLK